MIMQILTATELVFWSSPCLYYVFKALLVCVIAVVNYFFIKGAIGDIGKC